MGDIVVKFGEKKDGVEYYTENGIMGNASNLSCLFENMAHQRLGIRRYNVVKLGNEYMVNSRNKEMKRIRTNYKYEMTNADIEDLINTEYGKHILGLLYEMYTDLDVQFLYAVLTNVATDMSIAYGDIVRFKEYEISEEVFDRLNPSKEFEKNAEVVENKEESPKRPIKDRREKGAIVSGCKWRISRGVYVGLLEDGEDDTKTDDDFAKVDTYVNGCFKDITHLMLQDDLRYLLKITKKRTFEKGIPELPMMIEGDVIEDFYYQMVTGIRKLYIIHSYFKEPSSKGIAKNVRENVKGIIKRMNVITNPYLYSHIMERLFFVSNIYYRNPKEMPERLFELLNNNIIYRELQCVQETYMMKYSELRDVLDVKYSLYRFYNTLLRDYECDDATKLYEKCLFFVIDTEAKENNAVLIERAINLVSELQEMSLQEREKVLGEINSIDDFEELLVKVFRKSAINERRICTDKCKYKKRLLPSQMRNRFTQEVVNINNRHLSDIREYLNSNPFFTLSGMDDLSELLSETHNVDLLDCLQRKYQLN